MSQQDADTRADISELMKQWAFAINLRSGPYASKPTDLFDAYCEWLEAYEPGFGKSCRRLFSVERWTRVFKETFPKVTVKGTRGNNGRTVVMTNYIVTPRQERPETKWDQCPHCKQPYIVEKVEKVEETPAPSPLCSVEGCDRKKQVRGMCEKHYRRRPGQVAVPVPEGQANEGEKKRWTVE